MDFIHDQLYDGCRIRILTVIDTFTRYVPVIEVRERFTGADVAAVLESVCKEVGYPFSDTDRLVNAGTFWTASACACAIHWRSIKKRVALRNHSGPGPEPQGNM